MCSKWDRRHNATYCSVTLDTIDMFDIGRKFERSSVPSEAFLRIGVIDEVFSRIGTIPELSDWFMTTRRMGARSAEQDFMICMGTGSKIHCLFGRFVRHDNMSVRLAGGNVFNRVILLLGMWMLIVVGGSDDRIVRVLSAK